MVVVVLAADPDGATASDNSIQFLIQRLCEWGKMKVAQNLVDLIRGA